MGKLKVLFDTLILTMFFSAVLFVGAEELPNQPPCNGRELIIGWHDYKPYSFRSADGKKIVGEDIELISRMLSRLNCRYKFVEMTWKRTLNEIEMGRVDIGMFASKIPQREGTFYFTFPYRNESVRIAVLAENVGDWPLKTIRDLSNFNIIMATDFYSWSGEAFQEFIERDYNKNIVHVHGTDIRLKMLLAKRVNGIIADPKAVIYEANILGEIQSIAFHPYKIYDNPVHFVLAMKTNSEKLRDALNDLLDEVKQLETH
jgi:polar amino acid transport system substrate-binding protein